MKFVSNVECTGRTITARLPQGSAISDGKYIIELTDVKENRTIKQNRYMWKLIRKISLAENGTATDDDCNAIYRNLLRMAQVKCDEWECPKGSINIIKRYIPTRDYEVLAETDEQCLVRVFVGTSQMDTKEMSEFIEVVVRYASELGIETDYEAEMFDG